MLPLLTFSFSCCVLLPSFVWSSSLRMHQLSTTLKYPSSQNSFPFPLRDLHLSPAVFVSLFGMWPSRSEKIFVPFSGMCSSAGRKDKKGWSTFGRKYIFFPHPSVYASPGGLPQCSRTSSELGVSSQSILPGKPLKECARHIHHRLSWFHFSTKEQLVTSTLQRIDKLLYLCWHLTLNLEQAVRFSFRTGGL